MNPNNLKKSFIWKQRLGFGICDFACNIAYLLVNTYLLFYYTDIASINAASIGFMFVVTKLIDAGTDYMVGSFVDRTHTKLGQCRPWMIAGAPVLAVGMVLLFCVPTGFSPTAKLVYAYATYILFSFGYTLVNIPMNALLPALTPEPLERTNITTTRMLMASLGSLVSASFVIPAVNFFSDNGKNMAVGYRYTNMVLAIVVIVIVFLSAINVKEINPAPVVEKKTSLITDFKYVISNKPFMIVFIETFLLCVAWLGASGAMQYYFTYIVGDVSKMTLATSLMTVGQFISQLLASVANRFMSKRDIMQISTVFMLIGFIGLLLVHGNLVLIYAFVFCVGFGLGARLVMVFSMIADTIDYGEYLHGKSMSGTQNAFAGFMNKFSSATVSALTSALLVWGHYSASATTQPDSAITAIQLAFCGVPLILCILSLILMAFYKLDKIYPEIKKENDARRAKENN